MSIPIGPTLDEGVWHEPCYYYEPNDGNVGSTVSNYSTKGMGQASVETESAAIPKAGEYVTIFDMDIVMALFGEMR